MPDPISNFREAISSAGLEPPEAIQADGILHRFSTNRKASDDAGWYILHTDGIAAGEYGCHRHQIAGSWSARKPSEMTAEERGDYQRKIAETKRQKDAERARRYAEARTCAAESWARATAETGEHRYLRDKGVNAHGIRTDGQRLIVPMRDTEGVLHSIQHIDPAGIKRYLAGGRVSGCYHAIGKPNGTLCVCEGYATGASIYEATDHAVAVAFDGGNLKPVATALRHKYPDLRLLICADNDQWTEGNPGTTKARDAALAAHALTVVPRFKDATTQPTDFNDLHGLEGVSAVAAQIRAALDEPTRSEFYAIEIADFLSLKFPPRDYILAPWLPLQGLAMIHAPRGVGKTHVSLDIAYAVASGGKFLRWEAPQPRGVLFIDGEMPGRTLQERLALIVAASEREPAAPLRLITPDLQRLGMPDLGSADGQAAMEAFMDGIALIIIDNISTLVRSGKENEAEGWLTVQGWALRQRAQGRSIVFVHHSGKGGGQRGTSKREDVLDTVISLRRPPDYKPEDGAKFELHFEKSRGFYGKDAEPFEAQLITDAHGRQCWSMRSLDESNYERIVKLLNDGLSQKEITIELSLSKSTVNYHAKRAREDGRVSK